LKLKVLNAICTTLALTWANTIGSIGVSKAQELTFICGTINEEPTIIAQTAQGNIPVIRWVSEDFQVLGINSRSQCEQMAQKLQKDCVKPAEGREPIAVCNIIQGGTSSGGSGSYEQLPPLWGSDSQLSQFPPAKNSTVSVDMQRNLFLNEFPPRVGIPGDRNILPMAPSPTNIKKNDSEPELPLW